MSDKRKLTFHSCLSGGTNVSLLHSLLQPLGYKIATSELENHSYGKSIRDAIISFQKQKKLKVTGIVDAATFLAINKTFKKTNS